MRQVTHALLTRPPLSHKIFISEENQIECFVRLACVKHAASVHPEPGSNSHVIICLTLSRYYLAYHFSVLANTIRDFTVFRLLLLISDQKRFVCQPNIFGFDSLRFKIFQGYFTVQLSKFQRLCFAKPSKLLCNFSVLLFSSQRQLIYYITFKLVCQQLFLFFERMFFHYYTEENILSRKVWRLSCVVSQAVSFNTLTEAFLFVNNFFHFLPANCLGFAVSLIILSH